MRLAVIRFYRRDGCLTLSIDGPNSDSSHFCVTNIHSGDIRRMQRPLLLCSVSRLGTWLSNLRTAAVKDLCVLCSGLHRSTVLDI